MTATRLDITIEQGEDYGTPFTLAGLDLTGYSAALQIKPQGYPVAVLTLTSADGTLAIDPDAATVTPIIPGATTAALNAGRYSYDLKLRARDGTLTRAYQGDAYVSEEVTDFVITPTYAILLESGGYLLLESGGRILLEDVVPPAYLLLENGGYLLNETGGKIILEA